VKIALAQINYHIGHFESNINKIKEAIGKAKKANARLIIFAELAISGYPPRDFLEFNDFIEKCYSAIDEIAKACEGIAAIIGAPTTNSNKKGKRLYNSAIFIDNGKVQSIHNKTLLPNYDIFDEYRYFEPNSIFDIISLDDHKFAVTICEDLWYTGEHLLYTVSPMNELIKQSPDMIINIAASPFHYSQANERKRVLSENAKQYKLPLLYVNHVGAQTELLFDGGSLGMNARGEVHEELKYFEEDLRIFDTAEMMDTSLQKSKNLVSEDFSKMQLIHDALIMGIKNYFEKLGFDKAILGLSGGIDSAVTFALAAKALGSENVKAILLPSQFSSDHSVNDAKELAKNMGSPYEVISIEEAYQGIEGTLKSQFSGLKFDLTEENIQARLRAIVLMAMSNKFGYILLNTSNKSEAAVGYGTLYGDMCGGLSVLGDVYKTEVFQLAEYINKEKEIIPLNTIVKPPSAELRPDQKDSDSLPEYEILDTILYQYIEQRKGPAELIKMGFQKEIVDRILKLVNTNEYKRYQTPPILRVSRKAFGMGRRMPIVARYLS